MIRRMTISGIVLYDARMANSIWHPYYFGYIGKNSLNKFYAWWRNNFLSYQSIENIRACLWVVVESNKDGFIDICHPLPWAHKRISDRKLHAELFFTVFRTREEAESYYDSLESLLRLENLTM